MDTTTENRATSKVAKRSPRNTDTTAHFTPAQLGHRWAWHTESIRRAIRQRRIAAVIIGRRLLVPRDEVERIEREGFVARCA